ncbi:MAG: hypothetical protein ACNA7W_13595 [Pseudomonadales bacterium]
MNILSDQYLKPPVREEFARAAPTRGDRDVLEAVRQRLQAELSLSLPFSGEELEWTLELTARARIFLDDLDRLTRWRIDHPR